MKSEAKGLKLLLQQRELVEIIILISFLNSNILFETWNVNLSPTCCLLVCDIISFAFNATINAILLLNC